MHGRPREAVVRPVDVGAAAPEPGGRGEILLWRAGLVAGAVATAAVIAGVAAQWVVIGAPAGNWWYKYLRSVPGGALATGILAGAAAIALARLPGPATRRQECALVLCWILAGLLLQGFIRSAHPFSLQQIFLSDGANSFYSVTQQQEPGRVLSAFNRVRRESALHAQSNMPGKVMLLYALEEVTARTDVLPWLLAAISTCGAVLMYVFVRAVFADRMIALYSAILYLFVPARLAFLPLMNTVTPVVLLAALCLLMQWLNSARAGWAVLLGAMLYGMVFFEPLPLVTGLLFAGLSLRAIAAGSMTWQTFALHAALMSLAFVATAETVHLIWGFDLAGAFRGIREHAVEFNASEGRPYGLWVAANLWEFAFGTGICQSVLFLAALVVAARAAVDRRGASQPLFVVTVSLAAVIAATDLIGINRGEVMRLWIFLACLCQIPAAVACARLARPAAIAVVLAASILQATLATSTIGFIVP